MNPLIINILQKNLQSQDLKVIKNSVRALLSEINQSPDLEIEYSFKNQTHNVSKSFLINDLNQILETQTLERTHYYLARLVKALSEVKTLKINDLNLNRWKEYEDILTDSLWLIDKRDTSGAHSAGYWGNFIPQIPNQLMRRYTKKGDWVLDTFLGSGTTLLEAQRLGRNGIGIELQPQVAELAHKNLLSETNSQQTKTEIIVQNSLTVDYEFICKSLNINQLQLIIMHPPYWDIIRFSEDKADLSNASSMQDFLEKMGELVDKTYPILETGRYLALIISDKYEKGEWIPMGFLAMQEVLKRKFILKSIVVKNFEETKGKMNQKELWRYRALAGGFYVFKHEYIYLFQKK